MCFQEFTKEKGRVFSDSLDLELTSSSYQVLELAKISELVGGENLLGAMPSALMPRIFVNRAEVGDLEVEIAS